MADTLFVLALAYRVPLDVAGSYVTARLAPSRPLRHALVLGAVGTVLATVGAVAMGKLAPAGYANSRQRGRGLPLRLAWRPRCANARESRRVGEEYPDMRAFVKTGERSGSRAPRDFWPPGRALE